MAGYVSPERKALQNKANIFIIAGIVFSIGSRVTMSMLEQGANPSAPTPPNIGMLVLVFLVSVASLACWMIGLSAYARSKGYSGWFALLGFLSCCGLIILAVMPNRWVDTQPGGMSGDYPRPQG